MIIYICTSLPYVATCLENVLLLWTCVRLTYILHSSVDLTFTTSK